jgi:hypothetical protein
MADPAGSIVKFSIKMQGAIGFVQPFMIVPAPSRLLELLCQLLKPVEDYLNLANLRARFDE